MGVVYRLSDPPEGEHLLDAVAHTVWLGQALDDRTGRTLAWGELGGPGSFTVVIGAEGIADNPNGTVWVTDTSAAGELDVADVAWGLRGREGSRLGHALLADTDLDGDGQDDLVVGAPDDGGGGAGAGAVWVVTHMGATGTEAAVDTVAAATLLGAEAYAGLGAAVASEDFNGDGVADLALGLPAWSGNSGMVAVAWGPLEALTSLDDLDDRVTGQPGDELGFAVVAVGDRNGMGLGDFAASAPGADGGVEGAGGVWLFLGETPLTGSLSSQTNRAYGEAAGDRAGLSLATGQLDDALPGDLLVGAQAEDGAGRVYVVTSVIFGATPLAEAGAVIPGLAPGDRFGAAVSAVPDLAGDGFDGLLLGGWGVGGEAGAAWLLGGRTGL